MTAGDKAALLALLDDAQAAGYRLGRACRLLEIDERRVRRWRARRAGGQLADGRPGRAVHGLLDEEVAAVLEIVDRWGEIDGSHRKLAHRGSYEHTVWVSPSSVRRIMAQHGLMLPQAPRRPPAPAPVWPDWLVWAPNRVWIYDASEFSRARRVCFAIVDVVSRYWISFLLCSKQAADATQIRTLFLNALEDQGLDIEVAARLDAPGDGSDDQVPLLLACSDNGPPMAAASTRQFLAMCAIAQRLGRPGTPTDQAWIESFFSHLKREHPHLETITDPAVLQRTMAQVRRFYNQVRLHEAVGYVTPEDEHHGRGPAIRQARREGMAAARQQRLDYHRTITNNTPS